MKELLEVIVFDTAFAWIAITVTLLIVALTPKIFGVKSLNGLLFAQITLIFNAITIIAGLSTDSLTISHGIHFFSIELGFLAAMYAVYRRLLTHRRMVLNALQSFFDGFGAIPFVGFIIFIAIFNYFVAPTDGSSRIGYMTSAWFSLIKPFIQVALPLSYLGVFILLLNKKRRWLGYVLLITAISSNILTGSKASFVLGLLSAFLALRDLSFNPQLLLRRTDKLKLFLLVAIAANFTLIRLEVSATDLAGRFFLFGEANILTYFSNEPTAACENVSTFAKMHRGLARLAGDESANDIDTLFGYALMIEALGENTLTGPNARLSAYALCNFPGEDIIFLLAVISIYFGLLLALVNRSKFQPTNLAIFYPFTITSLGAASQDFSLIMQDIGYYSILFLFTIPLYAKKRSQRA